MMTSNPLREQAISFCLKQGQRPAAEAVKLGVAPSTLRFWLCWARPERELLELQQRQGQIEQELHQGAMQLELLRQILDSATDKERCWIGGLARPIRPLPRRCAGAEGPGTPEPWRGPIDAGGLEATRVVRGNRAMALQHCGEWFDHRPVVADGVCLDPRLMVVVGIKASDQQQPGGVGVETEQR